MLTVLTALIPAGETESNVVDLTGVTAVVGVVMPPDWSGANVTMRGSPDGVFFYDLHDGITGSELSFNVKPGSLVMVNPNRMRSCVAIRLRSGSSSAPVPQQASRQFGIVVEGDGVTAQPATGTCAHITEDATENFHGLAQPFVFGGPNVKVQASIKSNNRAAGFAISNANGGCVVNFDLNSSAAYAQNVWGAGFAPFHEAVIEGPGANGWWQCSASVVLPNVAGLKFAISLDTGAQGPYVGDGVSFLSVWMPSLVFGDGNNVLASPEDLTDPVWQPMAVTVENFADELLPATP